MLNINDLILALAGLVVAFVGGYIVGKVNEWFAMIVFLIGMGMVTWGVSSMIVYAPMLR